MSAIQPSDLLVRVTAKPRYGVLTRRLAPIARGGEQLQETFARADATPCATLFGWDGKLYTAAANKPRLDYSDGLVDAAGNKLSTIRFEGSRVNVVLWNRDLTNAAWVKTGGGGVTAAKDQTGLDGIASSCSRITANGANGTCLQAITLGSSARFQSVYLKRLVGTGNIDMTMDNGATWTTVLTGAAGATFTRVTIPTQTLANPTVGFRIVTNADSVAVDFVQNEGGVFQSSPIAVTTVAVTRAADSLTVPMPFGVQDLTMYVSMARPAHADAAGTIGSNPGIFALGTAANQVRGHANLGASRNLSLYIDSVTDCELDTAIPAGNPLTICWQLQNLTTGGKSRCDTGSGFGAFSSLASGFAAFNAQTMLVGSYAAGQELFGGLIDLMVVGGLRTLAECLAASNA